MNDDKCKLNELIKMAKFGDTIMVRTFGIGGCTIRWWTNGYFNHTANYDVDGYVYDSTLKYGVARRHISSLKKIEWAILRPNQSYDKDKLRESYLKYKDDKYDVTAIVSFFIPFVKQNDTRLFCSEFTSISYKDAGLIVVPRKGYDKIHPEMIYQSSKMDEIARFTFKDGLKVFGNQ